MQFHDGDVCQYGDLIGQVAGVSRREMAASGWMLAGYQILEGVS